MLVVHGGYNPFTTADAWRFPGTISATAQPFGTACGAMSLQSSLPPIVGQTSQALLSRQGGIGIPFMMIGFSESMLGAFALPLPMDGFGFSGCWLHQDAVALGLTCSTTAPDQAEYSLPIPDAAVLSGFRVYLQGYSLVPGANPGGIVMSNALRLVLGNF